MSLLVLLQPSPTNPTVLAGVATGTGAASSVSFPAQAGLSLRMGAPTNIWSAPAGAAAGAGLAWTTGGMAIILQGGRASATGAANAATGTIAGSDPAWATSLRARMTGLSYTATVTAPDTIPHDGIVSSSAALQSWINSVSDGPSASTHRKLVIPSGWILRLTGDGGIDLSSRHNMTLDATGSSVNWQTSGASALSSAFFMNAATSICFRNWTLMGEATATGTADAVWVWPNASIHAAQQETTNSASIRRGCVDIEFDGCSWDQVRGFGIFVCQEGSGNLPDGVWLHDSYHRGGEAVLDWVAGQHVLMEGMDVYDCNWSAIDVEPDDENGSCTDGLIQDNTFTRYGWEGLYQENAPYDWGYDTSGNFVGVGNGVPGILASGRSGHTHWWIGANPGYDDLSGGASQDSWMQMDRIWLRRNHIVEGHVIGTPGASGAQNMGGGGIQVRMNKINPKTDIRIEDNVSDDPQTVQSGVYVSNVNGLSVKGNTQTTLGHLALVRTDTSPSGVHVTTPNTV